MSIAFDRFCFTVVLMIPLADDFGLEGWLVLPGQVETYPPSIARTNKSIGGNPTVAWRNVAKFFLFF